MWPPEAHSREQELSAKLTAAGVRHRRLTPDEHCAAEATWRQTYRRTFAEPLRFKRGAKAVDAFRAQAVLRWRVVPFLSDVPGTPVDVHAPVVGAFECEGPLIEHEALSDLECFVSPEDGSWTFMRTHEDFALGGPYFVRREWTDQLPRAAKRVIRGRLGCLRLP